MTSAASSARVQRKQAETRARILATAARRFAELGIEGVRLDELAHDADVARGTLYNYFATKDALVSGIMRPVLEEASRGVEALAALGPRRSVEGLIRLYLALWKAHGDALRVAYHAQGRPLGDLLDLHAEFVGGVIAVLEKAAKARMLRTGDPALSALLLSRVAVPMLEVCGNSDDRDRLFVDSMRGLLLSERTEEG